MVFFDKFFARRAWKKLFLYNSESVLSQDIGEIFYFGLFQQCIRFTLKIYLI